jgi:meso-butanediol dehydrogenase / (S,S)-butanediol dehydrogenase / diacetyl reductase
MRLPDTIALVTGGGSGIGRAIALRFANEGAKVVVADRFRERAQSVAGEIAAAGGEALAVEADVRDRAAVGAMVEQAVARFGRVDVLVNNAGLSTGGDPLQQDEPTWDLNFDVVLKGAFFCAQAVLPGMLERGRGVILNVASVNGLTGIGEEAYSAAKAGMVNLTQNLAVRYGDRGVRVNCAAPGTVRTPIWSERVARDPQVFDKLAAWYPLGRVGEPEDVANAALFLCSAEAAWITGVTLPVDGGLLAGSYKMSRDLGGE